MMGAFHDLYAANHCMQVLSSQR